MRTTLLFAGALALLLAGPAIAKDHAAGAHAHKVHKTETARAARRATAPPKDPYAGYWNDPSRAAPPFSWGGHDVR